MTPALTDADREAIYRLRCELDIDSASYTELVYLAGLAAGMERERERAAATCMELEIPKVIVDIGLQPRSVYWQACVDCAAAIREQAKGAK